MSQRKEDEADIDKMIYFIEHEATEMIKELHLSGLDDYNSEKTKLIKDGIDAIKMNYSKSKEEIKSEFNSKLSKIKNRRNQEILNKKREILKKLFIKVIEKLKHKNVNTKILKSVADKLTINNKNEKMIFTVKKSDEEIARQFSNRYYNGNIEVIGTTNKNFFGGVIGTTRDTKVICDNSYFNRLSIVWEKHVGDISKYLGMLE